MATDESEKQSRSFTLMLPLRHYELLEAYANEFSCPKSAIAGEAIRHYLDRVRQKHPLKKTRARLTFDDVKGKIEAEG